MKTSTIGGHPFLTGGELAHLSGYNKKEIYNQSAPSSVAALPQPEGLSFNTNSFGV